MVYIEIPYIEDLSMWMRGLQGLMAGGKVLEEVRIVSRGGMRTITKTKNNGIGGETDFEPDGIEKVRFKIQEPCNRCVDVRVSTNPTIGAETRDKVKVRDRKKIRGSISGNLSFGE